MWTNHSSVSYLGVRVVLGPQPHELVELTERLPGLTASFLKKLPLVDAAPERRAAFSLGQHAVRPEAVEQMLIEVGTEGELSKRDMAQLLSSTGEMDIGRRKKRNSTTPKA